MQALSHDKVYYELSVRLWQDICEGDVEKGQIHKPGSLLYYKPADCKHRLVCEYYPLHACRLLARSDSA